ncbi:MAG: tetratricopeptide repeat protein [Verrucomicrobia bacterium]|jgi:Tfp pilus assembly protein PilF|nr:tetratricopeptide repeat protein [Verrucomicrobiota bacterium]
MKKQQATKNSIGREKTILLGFVVQRKNLDGRMEISVRWGRLLGAFLGLALIGWFALAGALYFHFKYNKEFEDVAYTKMLTLLPFGLDKHREEMGNYHIDRGLEQMREGNYRDALRLLRLGVARAPNNLEGRMVLAEFYEIALKRFDIAGDQLKQGLERGGIENIDYVRQTLRFLLRHQLDEEIQRIADKYLPTEPELSDINRVIAFGAANANHLRGNYDRAEDYLTNYRLIESIEGVRLSAEISWDRGNRQSAIEKLEQSLRTFPNSGPLLMQLSRYHREMGEIDEARRYAILRNVSDPLSPAPRLELLYIHNMAGDTERENRETQRLLVQFRDDQSALQSIANFAADTGNIQLARRTYEEALENEFSIDAFALLLIEAHLVDEDYAGALEFCEELLKESPDWLMRRWAVFNSLRAVASYAINRPDLGDIYLQDFLNESGIAAETYLAVARRFRHIDRVQQTRRVLMDAYESNPNNQKVLSELIRTDLDLGNTENLNQLITRLLQMRRPQMNLIADAYRKLGSDRFIFTPGREALLMQLGAVLRDNSMPNI